MDTSRRVDACFLISGWRICLCGGLNDPEAKLVFLCSTGSSQLFIKQPCTCTNNAAVGVSALQTCCRRCMHALLQELKVYILITSREIYPIFPPGFLSKTIKKSPVSDGCETLWADNRKKKFKMSVQAPDSWDKLFSSPSLSSLPSHQLSSCDLNLWDSESSALEEKRSAGSWCIAAASKPRKRRGKPSGRVREEGGGGSGKRWMREGWQTTTPLNQAVKKKPRFGRLCSQKLKNRLNKQTNMSGWKRDDVTWGSVLTPRQGGCQAWYQAPLRMWGRFNKNHQSEQFH